MSDRAQIESDAILARRLQEDEQRHMANLTTSGHSAHSDPAPTTNSPSALPPSMHPDHQIPYQPYRATHFPFARGPTSFHPAEMMGDLFQTIAESAAVASAQGLREDVLRGIEDDSVRPPTLRSAQPFPSRPSHQADPTLPSLDEFYERNRRNMEQAMPPPTYSPRDRPRSNTGGRRSGRPENIDPIGAHFFNEIASSFGSLNLPGGRPHQRQSNSRNYGRTRPAFPSDYPQHAASTSDRRDPRNAFHNANNSNNPSDTPHFGASGRATMFGTPEGFTGAVGGQGFTAMAGNFSEITRMIQSAVTSGQGLDPDVTNQMQELMRAAISGLEIAGDGEGSYEDWLSLIERMGGNVNRSATDEEIGSLRTKKFQSPPASSSHADGAGPSHGAPASSSTPQVIEKCSICLLEFDDGEDVKCMPCTHIFHPECIDRWLKINRTCPVCKQSLRADDGPAA